MSVEPLRAPTPDTELDIDLAGCSLHAIRENRKVSGDVASALARAESFIDAGRTRAAAAALAAVQEIDASGVIRTSLEIRGLKAGLEIRLGEHEKGEKDTLDTLAECQRNDFRNPALEAALLNNLGVIAFHLYRKPGIAAERFASAAAIADAGGAALERQNALYSRNLGIVRDAVGDYEGAAEAYRRALRRTDDDPVAGLNVVEMLSRNRELSGNIHEAESYLIAAFLNLRTWSDEFPRLFMRAAEVLSIHLLIKVDLERLGSVAREYAAVSLSALPESEHHEAVRPLTFQALSDWSEERLFDAGECLRQISALRRRAQAPVPGAVEITEGILSLHEKLGIKKRHDVFTTFKAFAARLPF